MSGENSYYNTLDPEISGFTLGFGMGSISYDVDGNQIVDGLPSGYVYGDGQTGNSKFIFRNTGTHTIPIHPYNNQISFLTGATSTFNDTMVDWFTSNLPIVSDTEWTVAEGFTYQDSIHTTNALSGIGNESFGGPVDFMNGNNSYYSTVNPDVSPSGIPGFTNNFKTGGYTFGIGDLGNSRFLTEDGVAITTGTHVSYHNSGLTFSDLEGSIGVDFMSGKSLHEASMVNSGSISGFNIKYSPGTWGGWSVDSPLGSSKLISMWWKNPDVQDAESSMLTSLWNGYDHEYKSVSFNSDWSYVNKIPDGESGNFSKWDIPSSFTYSENSLTPTLGDNLEELMAAGGIYSGNPNPTTSHNVVFSSSLDAGGFDVGTGYKVNFMNGKSLHEDSKKDDSDFVISGFDVNYNPGLFGGWSSTNTKGDSKLLSMWSTTDDIDAGSVVTTYYTGYLDTPSDLLDFPGPVTVFGSEFSLNRGNVVYPGGYTSLNEKGSSDFLIEDQDSKMVVKESSPSQYSIYGYGGSDSFSGMLTFDGSGGSYSEAVGWDKVLLESQIEIDYSQFLVLYNQFSFC